MKQNTLFKRLMCLMLGGAMVFAFAACGEREERPEKDPDGNMTDDQDKDDNDKENENPMKWDTQTSGPVMTRPHVSDGLTNEILQDLNFSRGFRVSPFHSNTSTTAPWGALTYGGDKAAGDPLWQLAQWGCTHDLRENTEEKFTREKNILSYDDGGKTISVDIQKTGKITLAIKGSEEYTRDADGAVRERTDPTENWPHILIEQALGHDISADISHLYMEVEYEVTKCESLIDTAKYHHDDSLNAAQFQWFITLTDTDEGSESYGRSMWFGFSMFDSRNIGDTPPATASYDGGKEDSTGLFIYMFSLKTRMAAIEADVPTAVIGEKRSVKVDILPLLANALRRAKDMGAMTGASVEHLRIGSTNIGWELPGNFDVEVKIDRLNMYEEA